MKRAIISVTNDLVSDQRINRTASTLSNSGFIVMLVGRKLPGSLPYNGCYEAKRFTMLFNRGFFFYAEYNLKLFCFLFFNNPDLFYSNDLDTLPANFLASKFHGKKLIYDSHEYFTGVPELQGRKFIRNIWKRIESFLLPKIQELITVSDSVSQKYFEDYGIKMKVVRNVPIITQKVEAVNLDFSNKKVIIYQGALNIDRGIELVIKAMKFLHNHVFVIVGSGDIEKELKLLSHEMEVNKKVVFTGKIPFKDLPSYTLLADVGISLEEDTNINYRFSLPNKLFDYIYAGIPVLVSDLPEMSKLVNEYGVGEVCINRNPEILAIQINEIIENKKKYKISLENAASELCWEKESEKLIEIISRL